MIEAMHFVLSSSVYKIIRLPMFREILKMTRQVNVVPDYLGKHASTATTFSYEGCSYHISHIDLILKCSVDKIKSINTRRY